MKKLVLFLIFFTNYFLVFTNSFEIAVKNVTMSPDKNNNYVFIEIEYIAKNEENNPLFLYDIAKKNDKHYELDTFSENTVMKRIYVFKPSNLNSWSASPGYNPCYPSFIMINPDRAYKGALSLTYQIPKSLNPYEIQYKFNFITSNYDIIKNRNNLSDAEITEKLLQDTIITFKL